MCGGGAKPKIPDTVVNTPEPTPPAPVINEGQGGSQAQSGTSNDTKRKGTASLRINLSVPGAAATGLNIPTG